MKPLCTSFPFNLRRVMRSRSTRALVVVLALVLSVANVLIVALPSMATAAADHGDTHATAVHPANHDHCAQDSGVSRMHAGHGADCACRTGKSCACVHVCGDVLALPVLAASTLVAARLRAALPPRAYATLQLPLLRPPIA